MVVRYCRSKELPRSSVITEVSVATRLAKATIWEEVNLCYGRADAVTSIGVATVSVDGLDVDSVSWRKTSAVVVPQGTGWIKTL